MSDNVHVDLAFSRVADVYPDKERRGMRRATAYPDDVDPLNKYEFHNCCITDWSTVPGLKLNLETMGFDTIDLSTINDLQAVLASIRQAAHISKEAASSVRRCLSGKKFKLSDGRSLHLLFIAPEGLIMRKSGPNGLKINPQELMSEMNGHSAAAAIHADQDVKGTPLRQMMHGFAPWIFRHQSPDGRNRVSPFCLVNIWIPLQQITRPLTLMDRSSLRKENQLRYALPTDSFLDRDEDKKENDIWAFLHHEKQKWYFNAQMDANNAYVFDTLGTPHGSMILPGEAVAEQYYSELLLAKEALENTQANTVGATRAFEQRELPTETPRPLRAAIGKMESLLSDFYQAHESVRENRALWLQQVDSVLDSLERKSVEMRVVAMVSPNIWPFNRNSH